MKITELKPLEKNPFKSKGDEQIQKIAKSIQDFERMLTIRKIVIDEKNEILGGNKRYFALKKLGYKEIPDEWVERVDDLTEDEKREFIVKDNSHWWSEWDYDLLSDWGVDLEDWGVDLPDWGVEEEEPEAQEQHKKLSDRFIIPPLSVLDTKQGTWQQRKNYWLSLGIKSEEGRDDGMTYAKSSQAPKFYEVKNELRKKGLPFGTDDVYDECIRRGYKLFGNENGSTSIFDPVLCELVYKWFNTPNGKILDPFAGGSVRGIVASKLGYDYLGNDLSETQIKANRLNAIEVLGAKEKYPVWTIGDSKHIDTIAEGYEADFVFSCPPYADLEVYSDMKEDISNMEYSDFIKSYREIIRKSCDILKQDRFAVFVVGDVRDKNGFYRNFVSDTIMAFWNCGVILYNELILVNQIGSGAMRAGKQFSNSRKVVKHHQNVLVFYKGNPKNIKSNYPELDLSYMDEEKEIDE